MNLSIFAFNVLWTNYFRLNKCSLATLKYGKGIRRMVTVNSLHINEHAYSVLIYIFMSCIQSNNEIGLTLSCLKFIYSISVFSIEFALKLAR